MKPRMVIFQVNQQQLYEKVITHKNTDNIKIDMDYL